MLLLLCRLFSNSLYRYSYCAPKPNWSFPCIPGSKYACLISHNVAAVLRPKSNPFCSTVGSPLLPAETTEVSGTTIDPSKPCSEIRDKDESSGFLQTGKDAASNELAFFNKLKDLSKINGLSIPLREYISLFCWFATTEGAFQSMEKQNFKTVLLDCLTLVNTANFEELTDIILVLSDLKGHSYLRGLTKYLGDVLPLVDSFVTPVVLQKLLTVLEALNKGHIFHSGLYDQLSKHCRKMDNSMLILFIVECNKHGLRCAPYIDEAMRQVSRKWLSMSEEEYFKLLNEICHYPRRYDKFFLQSAQSICNRVESIPSTCIYSILTICSKFYRHPTFSRLRVQIVNRLVSFPSDFDLPSTLRIFGTLRFFKPTRAVEAKLLAIIADVNGSGEAFSGLPISTILFVFSVLLDFPNSSRVHMLPIIDQIEKRISELETFANQALIKEIVLLFPTKSSELETAFIQKILEVFLRTASSLLLAAPQNVPIIECMNYFKLIHPPFIRETQSAIATHDCEELYLKPFSLPLAEFSVSNSLSAQLCDLFLIKYKGALEFLSFKPEVYLHSIIQSCFAIVVANSHNNKFFSLYLEALFSSKALMPYLGSNRENRLKLHHTMDACFLEFPYIINSINNHSEVIKCLKFCAFQLRNEEAFDQNEEKRRCRREIEDYFRKWDILPQLNALLDWACPFRLDVVLSYSSKCGISIVSNAEFFKVIAGAKMFQLNGYSALQNRLAKRRGWNIIPISVEHWTDLESNDNKIQLLRSILKRFDFFID